MYKLLILSLLTTVHCASYQRYDVTTPQYGQYSTYAPIANTYDTNYRSSYGNDLATFPRDGNRYPNYNPSGSSSGSALGSGYNTYSSGGLNSVNDGYYGSGGLYNQAGNPYQQSGYYSTQRYGEGFSSYEMPFMRGGMGEYCQNRSPQTGIWVDNLMGMWYGVEVVQHLAGDSRVDLSFSCIVIHLSEPADQPSSENPLFHVQHIKAKFRQEHRHLRLLWDEAGQTIEYSLYFRNDSAGYWQVFNGQNGTLSQRSTYQPFSGTVQVLKAVNDHLVLSFCQEPNGGRQAQLYSVLFSREPGNMPRWEVESIHNMLQNKKLSIASRRMVCGNSTDKASSSVIFSIFTCVMALVIGGKH